MNGASYCRSELTAPWGLTLPPMPGYMWFHMVTSGRMWLETGRRSGIGSSSGTSRSCRTGRARS
ncbi:MAG: cupin domain-containing protein [Chloroflexota bacterium]|nr:cupin domain-containing protein [Chloroflexota bacterium]